jgi:hypothetical protein
MFTRFKKRVSKRANSQPTLVEISKCDTIAPHGHRNQGHTKSNGGTRFDKLEGLLDQRYGARPRK